VSGARRVGVLAAQGGFDAHARALAAVGVAAREVRAPGDLDGLDGLVLPGGESGAQLVALARDGLEAPLRALLAADLPVLATCAGLILLAARVLVRAGEPATQRSFGALDVEVTRNAWGRQVRSFRAPLEGAGGASWGEALLIRAPRLTALGAVEVVAWARGEPVAVRRGRCWGLTCHPELVGNPRFHEAVFCGG